MYVSCYSPISDTFFTTPQVFPSIKGFISKKECVKLTDCSEISTSTGSKIFLQHQHRIRYYLLPITCVTSGYVQTVHSVICIRNLKNPYISRLHKPYKETLSHIYSDFKLFKHFHVLS